MRRKKPPRNRAFRGCLGTQQARHNDIIVPLVGGKSPKPPAKNRVAFFACDGVPPPFFSVRGVFRKIKSRRVAPSASLASE